MEFLKKLKNEFDRLSRRDKALALIAFAGAALLLMELL
jgi:hypothetical protein